MDTQNTTEESTTIVGRPTYMACFAGRQAAGPIVEQLVAIGYPEEDISVLFRPAGTDSAVDMLSGETAAGQDTDAAKAPADADGTTLILLHPTDAQLAAVRSTLSGMGATEMEYEPETVYTGEDSLAALGSAMAANVSTTRAANTKDAGAGEPGRYTIAGGDSAKETGSAPTGDTPQTLEQWEASANPTPDPATGAAADNRIYARFDTDTAAEKAPVAPLPDASDLKAEIDQLKGQVETVKKDLNERD
ncbi:MAG TPA: hypothetical protein VM536_13610 [Chloroflexia bacterium]|nr:hypothetical protein [Chloroflexia bacterium]